MDATEKNRRRLLVSVCAAVGCMIVVASIVFLKTRSSEIEREVSQPRAAAPGEGPSLGGVTSLEATGEPTSKVQAHPQEVPVPGAGVDNPDRLPVAAVDHGNVSGIEPATKDVAYLPPGVELIGAMRLSELWREPLLASFAMSPEIEKLVADLSEATSLLPRDVDRILLGFGGISKRAELTNIMSVKGLGEFCAIIRTNRPIDAQLLRLVERGAIATNHAGTTYYQFPHSARTRGITVHLAEPTLIVLADETGVRSVIERRGKKPTAGSFFDLPCDAPFLIVFAPEVRRSVWPQVLTSIVPWTINLDSQLSSVIQNNVKRVSCGVDLAGKSGVEFVLECTDAAAADQIQKALAQLHSPILKSLSDFKLGIRSSIAGLAEEGLNHGTIRTDRAMVRLSGAIPSLAGERGRQFGVLLAEFLTGRPVPVFRAGGGGEGPFKRSRSGQMVPLGLSLYAQTRWSGVGLPGRDGRQLPTILEVAVDLHGGPASQSMVYGKYKLEKARLNDGHTLEIVDNGQFLLLGDPFTSFVNVERSGSISHPDDGIRATFLFHQPKYVGGGVRVRSIAGSIKLRYPKGPSRTILISDLLSYDGKVLVHPELKAAGLRFEVTYNDPRLSLKLTEGDHAAVGDLILITRKGERLAEPIYRGGTRSDGVTFLRWFDKDTPSDIGLEMTILTDLAEVTVPFEFEDLAIPPLPPR